MGRFQLLGIAILIAGVLLLDFGLHSSNAPVEKRADTFLGHYTDQTMCYLVAGATAAIGGLLLVLLGLRAQR